MKWVRQLARALVQDADQADDLAQDAWSLALQQPPRTSSSWRGWFAQVMKNRAQDQRISLELRKPLEAKLQAPDGPATPEDTLLRLETQQALGESVRGLAEPYRSTILLRYFEGWSVRQIAVLEGVQSRAIESRLRRGRDLIRAQLEKRGPINAWASGLLLLARAQVAPALIPRSLGSGMLLAAAGLLAWLVWSSFSGREAANGTRLIQPAPEAAAGASMAAQAESSAGAIQRDPFVAPAVSLRFSVVDAFSEKPLAGVSVRGDFLDADNAVVARLRWVSTAELPFESPIPPEARLIRFETDSSSTHAGLREKNIYGWADMGRDPLIQIRTERLRGEILGRVLDLESRPVPGAEVGVWLRNGEGRGTAPERRIPVAADGSFSMPLAMAQEAELFLAPLAPGHCALRHFRLTKERPANAYVEGLELILAPARALRVTVLDAGGAPVPAAEVVIWPSQPTDEIPVFPLGHYEGRLQHLLTTNAAGRTPALLLDREIYSLAVRREGHAQQSLELPPDETDVTITLPPALLLSGRVLAPQGVPAAGVRVIVEGVGQEECQTDGAGGFELACPSQPGEEVRLILIPPAPFALQVIGPFDPQTQRDALDCRLEPSLRLAARLVGADGRLYEADPGLRAEVRGGPRSRQPNGDAASMESWAQLLPRPRPNPFAPESAAELQLDGLPAGLYLISFHGREGLLAEAWVAAGSPRADLVLGRYPEPRATLTGCLTRTPGGEPVQKFRIAGQRLASADSREFLPDVISLDCEAEDGRFRLQGIPPGWWQLWMADAEQGSLWGLEALQLQPESSTELEPRLDESFEGRLTILDPQGEPAAGYGVRLLDHKGQALIFGLPARFQAPLDEQGSLFLQHLPLHAPLRVELSAPGGRRWTLPAGSLDPQQAAWRHRLPQ